jgi:hypothetical protein
LVRVGFASIFMDAAKAVVLLNIVIKYSGKKVGYGVMGVGFFGGALVSASLVKVAFVHGNGAWRVFGEGIGAEAREACNVPPTKGFLECFEGRGE